jgi:hypothetical protein
MTRTIFNKQVIDSFDSAPTIGDRPVEGIKDGAYIIAEPGRNGDDLNMLQDAVYEHNVVLLGPGSYRADGLILPANVTLGTLNQGHGLADYGSAPTEIRARATAASPYVVSFAPGTTPRAESQALKGIAIAGNRVCGGVYTEGWYGIIRDVHISECGGPSLNVQSQSILVERCITTGPYWPAVNPGAPSGAVILGGADSWFRDCEFSASNVTGFNYRGNPVAAVYVTGGYHSLQGCIAEYGDYGWHLTGTALFNKFSTCRADRNWGHGVFNQGSYNMFSSCSSSDSNLADGAYSQWYTTGAYNAYAACKAWNALPGPESQYAFFDAVSKDSPFANHYEACGSPGGWDLAEWGGVGAHKVPWTPVTFQNNWVNDGGAFLSEVEYRRLDDVVTIRGYMKNGTLNQAFTNLPVGIRPPAAVSGTADVDGTHATVAAYASGDVFVFSPSTTRDRVGFTLSWSVLS